MVNKIISFLKKLFLGPDGDEFLEHGFAVGKRLIREEWNRQSFGILRIIRLSILVTNFVFLTIYLDEWIKSRKRSVVALYREALYVFEFALLGIVLFTSLHSSPLAVILVIYFLSSIIHNLAGGVFIWGDLAIDPSRSLILSFFNYAEAIVAFAILYRHYNCLNVAGLHPIQALYFSAVTGTTVGYGDLLHTNSTGQIIVVVQLAVFVLFVLLFLATLLSRSLSNKTK